MRSHSEVFKVQKALLSSDSNPPMLLYNRSRSVFVEVRDQELLNKFGMDDAKIYVNGYMDGNRFVYESFASQVQDW